MIDFAAEMENILNDDPLGLLDVKPKQTSLRTSDERLRSSFAEINAFLQENGREPAMSKDMNERKLHSRLKGIRANPVKAVALREIDEFALLEGVEIPAVKEIKNIDDVLEDDILGLLDEDSASTDMFEIRNIPKAHLSPDHVAKRKPCEEFEHFEPLFTKCHADLASKAKIMVRFQSERQISPTQMFLLQGMLVYIGNVGKWEKKNFGNVNARLYCVFENGTESNMLLRSLAAALWKDENSRQIVDHDQRDMFKKFDNVNTEDKETGHIYVLRSLSQEPQISTTEDLYKIGYSIHTAKERTKNATQDPTFLMAEVNIVSEYQTYNLDPQKFESLLHTFFGESCLNVDVVDLDGKRHTPREWFVAPLRVINTAVQLLISGEIINYRFDKDSSEIVPK